MDCRNFVDLLSEKSNGDITLLKLLTKSSWKTYLVFGQFLLSKDFRDGRCEGGLAVVDVPDGPDVEMGFVTFERLLVQNGTQGQGPHQPESGSRCYSDKPENRFGH